MAPLDDVSAHPVRDDGLDGQPVLNPLNGVDASGAPVHKSASEDAFAQEAAIFPELPLVEVRYDFSVKVTVPRSAEADEHPSVVHSLLGPAYTAYKLLKLRIAAKSGDHVPVPPPFSVVSILTDCHGTLPVGSLSLILASPGHGKSTLLRAFAGQVPHSQVEGHITWGGQTKDELASQGINLGLLTYYVDQNDNHLPFLTVRETVSFAAALSTVDPKHLVHPKLVAAAEERAERVIKMLHLEGCASTLVGNAVVRGVSGGERKRVSISEALVSNARLLCLDEISTGLDATVTFDIIASIRAWTRSMKGTVVMSLQQATPEAFNLFDDIILLREGTTVYHGARDALPHYLAARGFVPHAHEDLADYCVDMLNSPTTVLLRKDAALPPDALRTTADLAAAWRFVATDHPKAPPAPLALNSPFAVRQYAVTFPRPARAAFRALAVRQSKLSLRNSTVLKARCFVSCFNSIVLGLIWFQLGVSQGQAKLGLFVFSLAQMAFANFPETAWVVEFKRVALKQIKLGMYPASLYTAAATLLQVPIAAAESALFCCILYFMTNLERDAGRFFFFYLIVFLVNMAVGSLFRALAFALDTQEAAAAAPGPFIALQLVFAGFLIAPANMGTSMWMIWLYFSSVFAYGARSLSQNEFLSPSYQIYPAGFSTQAAMLAALPNSTSLPGAQLITAVGAAASSGLYYFPSSTCGSHPRLNCGTTSYGAETLEQLNINLKYEWKWGGVGYIVGFALLMIAVGTLAVSSKANAPAGRSGSTYTKDDRETGSGRPSHAAVVVTSDTASALPFKPVTVAWKELRYTVTLPEGGSRTLLQGVSGVALPGRLIALMGASGAGKTTLLDVIACRKTTGITEGGIFLNGFPREPKSFARLTAYCEQQDIHAALTTVEEALTFSAALRLPATVDNATRAAFVNEIIDLLELRPLSNRLVGEATDPSSLSPPQRKLLTIAVELVSNAPILFLDEPTSGLDARAAVVVMRLVRRIASTGRTCVTTIHQPSEDVYRRFDDLLLMQRGGYQAYYGPTGPKFQEYIESLPGSHPLPLGMNPASWMLDVLAGTDSTVDPNRSSIDGGRRRESDATEVVAVSDEGGPAAARAVVVAAHDGAMLDGVGLTEALHASPGWTNVWAAIEGACVPAPGAKPFAFEHAFSRSFPAQLRIVLGRTWVSYQRAVAYNVSRTKILFFLNLLFGTVWYKAQQAVDCAPAQASDAFVCTNTPDGVQSIGSIIFINSLFVSVTNVTSLLPYMFRMRSVFYRERAAGMYKPEAHSLSHFLVEMPFQLLTITLVITPLYFMVGFSPKPAQYFFYIFVVYICDLSFISLGQAFTAFFSTNAIASAVMSLILPIAAVFAGVYLPYPQIPEGASNGHPNVYLQWVFDINPVSHAVYALGATRFADPDRPSTVDHKIAVTQGNSVQLVDAQAYFETSRGTFYKERWRHVGYIFALGGGLQLGYQLLNRFVVHVTR